MIEKIRKNNITLPKALLIFIFISFGIVFFIENFVTSSSFDILSVRAMDDVAFQASLRTIHTYTNAAQFLSMNDYGYGWVFWAPMALITYPAYLLQQASGVDWLLIVLPRMVSLAFALGCVYLMYKIVSVYTKNEWIKLASVVLLPLFPTQAYFAGRFGTVCQAAFFCMLAVYLTVKYEELDRKRLRLIFLACAAAFSTKLTTVIILPMLALLILNRYNYKFNKENLKIWLTEILLAAVITVFLVSPAILLFAIVPERASGSIRSILYFVKNTQGKVDIIDNIKHGVAKASYFMPVFAALVIAMLVKAYFDFKKKKDAYRFDIISMLVGTGIACLYLCLTIGTGSVYVLQYSLSICFVLPLGLTVFDISDKRLWRTTTSIICVCLLFVQGVYLNQQIKKATSFNPFAYFQSAQKSKSTLNLISELKDTVEKNTPNDKKVNVLSDWELPVFMSPLDHSNIQFYSIWDDLQVWEKSNIDIIVLYKKSKGFMTEENFQKAIISATDDNKKKFLADRTARKAFKDTKVLYGNQWQLIADNDNYLMYKKT